MNALDCPRRALSAKGGTRTFMTDGRRGPPSKYPGDGFGPALEAGGSEGLGGWAMRFWRRGRRGVGELAAAILLLAAYAAPVRAGEGDRESVSYYRQVRPILQANCQGCHQPAKAKGGLAMTEFKRLLAGGDSEGVAVVPGHPEQGSLVKMITPKGGEARMPKGKSALSGVEIGLIAAWIEQGAKDDTPVDAKKHYDAEHPPSYTQPPVIASIDYSPDGKLLAVAGFHEVLLHRGDGAELAGRLVGLS
jgi:mono/diheme cytochrome c family protein